MTANAIRAKKLTPSPSKKVPDRRPQPAKRVCLSGLGKPHTFCSGGPAERICARCRRRLDAQARCLSPRAVPLRTHSE